MQVLHYFGGNGYGRYEEIAEGLNFLGVLFVAQYF